MKKLDLILACSRARAAALAAWSAISHYHGGAYHIEDKSDGPSTDADKLADRTLTDQLFRDYPPDEFGYLSEEFIRDPIRLERPAVWIIDPIDGTKEFIKGSMDFAIHVGFAVQEGELWLPAAGVVYHPLAGRLYSAIRGRGTYVEEETGAQGALSERWWARAAGDPPRKAGPEHFLAPEKIRVAGEQVVEKMTAVVSASHRTRRLMRVLELVPFARHYARGSIGVKVGEIVAGRADVYVNTERGHCKQWDLCAPHIVLEEAGGKVTDLDGAAITYNQEDVRLLGGIIASNGQAHDQLVELISPLTS